MHEFRIKFYFLPYKLTRIKSLYFTFLVLYECLHIMFEIAYDMKWWLSIKSKLSLDMLERITSKRDGENVMSEFRYAVSVQIGGDTVDGKLSIDASRMILYGN